MVTDTEVGVMWWRDDSFFHGSSSDRRPILIRASFVPPHAGGADWRRPIQRSELTDAEQLANNSLLEGPSESPTENQQLAADIRSLEATVRELKAVQASLESQYEQQSAHNEQRLAEAERLSREGELRLDQSRLAAKRLRELLVASEQSLAHRDNEVAELEQQLRDCRSEFANDLVEAKHQHAAESKWLRSIAESAESQAEERKEAIALHSAELEQLRDDNADHVREATVSFYEKSVAEDAMRRGLEELASEVQRLNAENRQLRIEMTKVHELDAAELQESVADRERTIDVSEDDVKQTILRQPGSASGERAA
jgi:hypothetical protein